MNMKITIILLYDCILTHIIVNILSIHTSIFVNIYILNSAYKCIWKLF